MTTAAIVFDHGSAVFKGGLSSETTPSVVLPMIKSTPKSLNGNTAEAESFQPFSVEDLANGNNMLSYPIENGVIRNWDYVEKLWQYNFENILKIKPEEHAVLLTEAPQNPKANRDNMAQILFEKYSVPKLLGMTQGVLSMFGAGQMNGIVLEIGHGVTQIVPMIEGYPISNSIQRSDMAGCDLTEYLMSKISALNKLNLTTRTDKEMIQGIKEKYCYVAQNTETEITNADNMCSYILPDGRNVKVDDEKFLCPELLFKPGLMGIKCKGIHKMLQHSILSCATDVRRILYSKIILSGGTTLLPGLSTRLTNEIKALAGENVQVKVNDVRDKYLAWMGGAVLANHSSFHSLCVTKKEYEEHGASILHKN